MTTKKTPSKALNISLWIAQGLLAAMFLMAGIMKSTQPIEQLATSLSWVSQAPSALVRFIGISEFLGGVGLLLPSLLRIKPILTPLAALGFFVIMILAFALHVFQGEYEVLGINVIIGAIALFIAWGRYKKVPITAK